MFNAFYIIRKSKLRGRPIPMYFGLFLPIVYILMPIIMFIPMYLDYSEWEADDFIIWVVFFWILMIYGFVLLIEGIKLRNVSNFKHNWWWILKKAKVTWIKKVKFNNGGRWYKVDVYYFEAEDCGMVYYSNGSTKWVLLWTSLDELILLYAKYWFTYDDRQSQKEALLNKLDELITENDYEIENSSIVSRITKTKKSAELKTDKATISLGYITPCWQIDENKVSVWDSVDVYVDPDKPERYWVDTDFLF